MQRQDLDMLAHGGRPFVMAGPASDVLVVRDGRWRLHAHHVSPLPPDLA